MPKLENTIDNLDKIYQLLLNLSLTTYHLNYQLPHYNKLDIISIKLQLISKLCIVNIFNFCS